MTTENILFVELSEFSREFKKLCKKYPTLEKDFQTFIKASLLVNPREHILIEWLWNGIKWEVYKAKKFRCQSISKNSNQSGIRVIYRYLEDENKIELAEIAFVEIYFKWDKENEDRARIKTYFSE